MSSPKDPKQSLVASFMQFLTEELANPSFSEDIKESIEVATQCLETAFGINPVDGSLPTKKPILEIFKSYLENNKEFEEAKTVISEEDKAKADTLKNEGNELMKGGKFSEALDLYTKAIQIDGTNPIYYCNRAAAHSKMENHQAALEDCKIAIKHDPNYSKAYCRLGLAYVNLNDCQRAKDAYKKAYELDPSESNKNNLTLAEQKFKEEQMSYGSGLNFGNFLNNPQMMSFASQLMTDPGMQNMLSNIMATATDPAGSANPTENSTGNTERPGLDAFLSAGQQFAAQMQASNPELVEQLKKAFQKPTEDQKDPDQSQN